jgi:pimeloyl-ACP methyl ester carboxylesterase
LLRPTCPDSVSLSRPERGRFEYSFDNLAKVVQAFTDAIGLDRYALYVFDYGAPVGFRLALARPERVTAIISQNGNAYEEGLSGGWAPLQACWRDPTPANREALRVLLTLETTRWQYVHGTPDENHVRRKPIGSTMH